MLFAYLLLAAQAATPAPIAVPTPAATPTPARRVREPKICRVGEPELGSIMATRICHTRLEWQILDGARQRQVDRDNENN